MAFVVEFEPIGIRLVCEEPLTIAAAARQAGVRLKTVCGGKALCGKCLVQIDTPAFNPLTQFERQILSPEQCAAGWRLACLAVAGQDMQVYLPPTSFSEDQVIQTEGQAEAGRVEAAVHLYPLQVERPTLMDPRADLQRIADGLSRQYAVSVSRAGLPALRRLSQTLRQSGTALTVAVADGELISALPGRVTTALGFAADIGTTKLACYLVDLNDGRIIAAKGVMNPQIRFGEDVISRLEAVLIDPENARRQQEEVVGALNQVAGELCRLHGFAPDDILDVCLVGNTAMHHLAIGLPVQPLAVSPFTPSLSSALNIPAAEIGFQAAPGARVYLPPPIAGFVGSDHLAFLLAEQFGEGPQARLGIDIGTNTEIALQAHGRVISCSTASGPAFEGAHISYGMRAAPGAIERVRIDADGVAHCEVIGDCPPVGICGSGILDALAEMAETGILNRRGSIQTEAKMVRRGAQNESIYVLAENPETQRSVVITQEDIHQVLLAKGAIRAGIEILMQTLGVAPAELDEIVLAGAFGSYLDPQHAIRIGLLPEVDRSKVRAVGNAAGAGARRMLASLSDRQRAAQLAHQLEYLEITLTPGFNRFFANGARLPANSMVN